MATSQPCLLAILVGAVLALALAYRYLRECDERHRALLLAALFDRPPQLRAIF